MTAGENFTLWPFLTNRPARKSDHTRKRSLKLEALEERQMLAVNPWEYASSMRDTHEYEDVSSYDPLDDMEDHWTEEDEAAAEAERLQLTAEALRERLRGYGVSSMVSKQVYGPFTVEQYRAVTFGLGVRNAGLDNPSLLNNGEFDNAFVVDTLLDMSDPTDGFISLREAIISANMFAGYDRITFASGLSGTIYLSGTALPTITEGVSIEGPGADVITIDAGGMSRIFVIVGTDPNAPTPDVPTGLSGESSATGDSVTLSWTASADANMYAVYRRVFGVQGDSWGQWSYLDETTETIYTDSTVNPETTYQYYLIAANDTTGKMSSPSNTVTVTTNPNIWIDLDIDSLNTSRFATPSRTQAEEDIEDDYTHYGKLIHPNYGDRDGDGILDCWDGLAFTGYYTQANPNSSEQFVPMVLQIAQNDLIDYANTTITFDYTMYEMSLPQDKTKAPEGRGGAIRIWTHDGHQVRVMWNLSDNGQLVENGVAFTLEELGFIDEYGDLITDTITLYVEGMEMSSSYDNIITVSVDYELVNGISLTLEDSIRYAVADQAIIGQITYTANDPVRYARITVENLPVYYPEIGYLDDVMITAYTNKNGYYFCALTEDERSNMEYVRVHTFSDELDAGRSVQVLSTYTISYPYQAKIFDAYNLTADQILRDSNNLIMQVDRNIASGTYGVSTTTQEAFYVYDAMVTAAQIHATLPDVTQNRVQAVYPSPVPATFAYNTVFIQSTLYNNWDTILHEYGHIVAQEAGFFAMDFPLHVSHHGYINSRDDYNHVCTSCAMLSFSEGWAHFYAAYAKQHKDAYLPSYIQATKNLYVGSDPDKNNYQGEDFEMAVMQLFWDLYDDNANESFDSVALGINGLYNLLRVNPKLTVDDVWDYLSGTVVSSPNYLDEMTRYGQIFAEHGMGATNINSSITTWQSGNNMPVFFWDVPKTTQNKYNLFDTYYVEFYDGLGNKILTSEPLGSWSSTIGTQQNWTPSSTQWSAIIGNSNVNSDGKVYWVIRCTNDWTRSPSFLYGSMTSGAYWSDRVGEIEIL